MVEGDQEACMMEGQERHVSVEDSDRQLPNAAEKSSKRETDILSLTLAMSKSWQNLARETSIMERGRWQLWD